MVLLEMEFFINSLFFFPQLEYATPPPSTPIQSYEKSFVNLSEDPVCTVSHFSLAASSTLFVSGKFS